MGVINIKMIFKSMELDDINQGENADLRRETNTDRNTEWDLVWEITFSSWAEEDVLAKTERNNQSGRRENQEKVIIWKLKEVNFWKGGVISYVKLYHKMKHAVDLGTWKPLTSYFSRSLGVLKSE